MDPPPFPVRLAPQEQLNILRFLTTPRRERLAALESMLRDFLQQSGPLSGGSFSLATTALPFRTPFTLQSEVEVMASRGRSIVSPNAVLWSRKCDTASTSVAARAYHSTTVTPNLKLSLRVKVNSPVPLHRS
jgi:hypothetical protein